MIKKISRFIRRAFRRSSIAGVRCPGCSQIVANFVDHSC